MAFDILMEAQLGVGNAGCGRTMCTVYVSTATNGGGTAAGTTTGMIELAGLFWGKWAGACGIGFQGEDAGQFGGTEEFSGAAERDQSHA